MPRYFILAILAALLCPASSHSADCLAAFLRAELGTPDAAQSSAKQEVFRLHKDHSVFRVIDRESGKSLISKQYPSSEALQNDLLGLGLLKGSPAFRTAAFSRGPTPNTMILNDVRGRSLKALLTDPAVPKVVSARLRDEYARKVKELESYLRGRYEIESLRYVEMGDKLPTFMARVIDPETGESVKIWMKADQVIVPETSDIERLEMVIIDPY